MSKRSEPSVLHPSTGCLCSPLRRSLARLVGLAGEQRVPLSRGCCSPRPCPIRLPQISSDNSYDNWKWSTSRTDVTWTTCRDSPIKTGERSTVARAEPIRGVGGEAWFQECGVQTAVGAVPASFLCTSHGYSGLRCPQWLTELCRGSFVFARMQDRPLKMAKGYLCHMFMKYLST